MAAPGNVLAERYRLVRRLGAGGMGVVWEAHDDRLDRRVAIKQLRTQVGSTDAETELAAQRALREARISARLQHPYAVSVFDVVEHEGQPCLVMELVPSIPLSEVLRELGSITPEEAARVGAQVGAALAAAHALGIVHRDVKPGNVLIGDDGTARICDFGISRALGDTTLTVTGMITGTPAYLSPESARGQEATAASDVYSLGATLYAAVEGESAFGPEGNAMALLYRVAAGEMRPPQRAGALGPLLTTMMNLDPQKRPTMAGAAERLASVAAGGAAQPTPPGADQTRVRPRDPVPAAATVALPTAGAAGPAHRPPDAESARPGPVPVRRPGRKRLVGVLLALALVIAGATAALVLRDRGQPLADAGPGAASATDARSREASSSSPVPTPSGNPTSTAPTSAELTRAIQDYYALLPDDTDAGWDLLTASYQGGVGGRESYDDFWNDIDTVDVGGLQATAPDQVQATVRYRAKSGNKTSTERRSFRLVPEGGVLKIDASSVI